MKKKTSWKSQRANPISNIIKTSCSINSPLISPKISRKNPQPWQFLGQSRQSLQNAYRGHKRNQKKNVCLYGRLESIRGSFCIFLVFRKDTITFHPCQVKLCWSVVFNTLIQRQSDLCLFLWLQAQIFKAFRGETSSSLSFICLFLFLLRDLLLNRGTVPLPMATRAA